MRLLAPASRADERMERRRPLPGSPLMSSRGKSPRHITPVDKHAICRLKVHNNSYRSVRIGGAGKLKAAVERDVAGPIDAAAQEVEDSVGSKRLQARAARAAVRRLGFARCGPRRSQPSAGANSSSANTVSSTGCSDGASSGTCRTGSYLPSMACRIGLAGSGTGHARRVARDSSALRAQRDACRLSTADTSP